MAKMRRFSNGITATFVPPYYWQIDVDGNFFENVDDGELTEEVERLSREIDSLSDSCMEAVLGGEV